MYVNFIFPQVMKMELAVQKEIPDDANLETVRKLAFDIFWDEYMKWFQPKIGKHGSSNTIVMKVGDAEICSEELRERLLVQNAVVSVFNSLHPKTP